MRVVAGKMRYISVGVLPISLATYPSGGPVHPPTCAAMDLCGVRRGIAERWWRRRRWRGEGGREDSSHSCPSLSSPPACLPACPPDGYCHRLALLWSRIDGTALHAFSVWVTSCLAYLGWFVAMWDVWDMCVSYIGVPPRPCLAGGALSVLRRAVSTLHGGRRVTRSLVRPSDKQGHGRKGRRRGSNAPSGQKSRSRRLNPRTAGCGQGRTDAVR